MTERSPHDGMSHAVARRPVAGVDVGHEPPLGTAGGEAPEVDRRDVNLRWLGASVLTAVTGAALLGTAIVVSLQGDSSFARLPERAAGLPPSPAEREARAAAKGDKLVRASMVASARHAFKAPMTLRAGDREVIRVRSFVRIATGLSQTSGVYASDIPPFNPLKLFAGGEGERVAEPQPEVGEADVSLVKRNLGEIVLASTAPALGDDDAVAQIEEERRLLMEAGQRPSMIPAQLMLSRTLRQPVAADIAAYARVIDTPFDTIEVRVVPENVTTLAKEDPRLSEALVEEHAAQIRRGDSLQSILKGFGATPEQIADVVAALGGRSAVGELAEGQQMRILVAPGPRPGDPRQVMRVILFGESGVEAIAAKNDRGAFVAVKPQEVEAEAQVAERNEDEEEDGGGRGGARLYESLYETAMKHDLPATVVQDLIRIFGYDVDFQRRVSGGDTFEIFFAEEEDGERLEVLFASLSVGGEARRVYRFQSPEDGTVDYFDEEGRSLKKFLLRKPITDGQLRSGFGMRRHPILGYSKMHTGVDWANRIGTPILSAGNGTVIKAEWDGGYGRRVEVQHANGYVTTYSHMSRFGQGIAPGARVRQGQILGYVGSTGLSTGPHLHYEVVVNGHFVDPMKIRVPRGRELEGRALAEFKRQREQVDAMLEKAGGGARFAQSDAR